MGLFPKKGIYFFIGYLGSTLAANFIFLPMLTDFAIGVSPKRVVPFVWLFGFLFVTY
jgi:hypothetical protein